MSHLEGIEKLKEEAIRKLTPGGGGYSEEDILGFLDRAFSLGGKSVIAQLLEAVPEIRKEEIQGFPINEKRGQYAVMYANGHNTCRQALIAKAIQLGVMENDKWTRESIGKEIPHP